MNTTVTKRKHSILAASITAALLITGCGGGGGGSSSSPTSSTTPSTLSGVASKGIIRHGLVIAEELDTNGNLRREVGTAETDVDGNYNLELDSSYGGGVVRLRITPKADGSTKMVCDVRPNCDGTLFGEEIDLTVAGGFEMQAVVPPVSSGVGVTAQITPYTHMAAARLNGQQYTAAAVANANSEVSQIVGVPILETPPLNIADSAAVANASLEAQQYAAFNAGLGELLFANTGGLQGGLGDLADTFSDGEFDPDDEIDISALATAVGGQAALSGITSETITQAVAVIESSITEGSYDPEPTDSAALPAIVQAKALVAEIRTLVNSIDALESPVQAFDMDLDVAAEVMDANAQALLEVAGMVIQSVLEAIDSGDLSLGVSADVNVLDRDGLQVGTVNAALGDNSGLTVSIRSTVVAGVTVGFEMTSSIPASAIDGFADMGALVFTMTGSVENAESRIAFNNINLSTTLAETVRYDSTTGELFDPGTTLLVDAQPTNLSFSGGLTVEDKLHAMSFEGTTEIEMVALTLGESENSVSLREISLNGTFAGNGNSFEAGIGFVVNNAATFDTIGALNHEPELWVQEWEVGDIFNAQAAANSLGITGFSYAQYSGWWGWQWGMPPNQTCFYSSNAPVCFSGDYLNTQQYILAQYPEAISVDLEYFIYYLHGGYTQYNADVEFPDFETVTNFANVTLTATLDLVLANHPTTTAVVTANRDSLEGGDVLVTLTHDGQSITLSTEVTGSAITTSVSNTGGVTMALTGLNSDEGISGTVTVNDQEVGTISETSSGIIILRYEDGSMESLQ